MKNSKIAFGMIVLFAVLVVFIVPSVIAQEDAVYFVPQHGTIPGGPGNNINVEVWVSTTSGFDTWGTDIAFDPTCINVTDVTYPTTGDWMMSGMGFAHFGNYITMGNMRVSCTSENPELLATLTVHCEASDCASALNFTWTDILCEDTQITLDWINGTVTNEAAPGIADHVVISEVQISGATANDEFVELYNPTNAPISLKDWYLTKKTSGGTSEYHLLAGFPATSIPAHGFFLITHQSGYTGPVTADATYGTTNSIAANNTVILYSDNKITVVDKVGFGAALDNETLSYPDNPGDDESLQRKINATIERDGYGPAWDTGNNSADFFIQTSNPRNSVSDPVEPIPELSTLMLLTTGLVALVGYVIVKKGRKG